MVVLPRTPGCLVAEVHLRGAPAARPDPPLRFSYVVRHRRFPLPDTTTHAHPVSLGSTERGLPERFAYSATPGWRASVQAEIKIVFFINQPKRNKM